MLGWRVLMAGKATMTELETIWTLDDVLKCIAIMDYESYVREKMEARAAQEAKRK